MSENAADWRFETKQIHSGAAPDPVTQGPRHADLPDHVVRLRQRRARAEPVRARRVRQHLHAHPEPDAGGRRGAPRRARGRHRRPARRLAARRPRRSPCSTSREAGDHIVSSRSIYGGTYNLFKYTLAKLGIETTFVENQDDADEWRRAVRPNTKLFFAETIGNPKINVLDIALVADVAHENGIPLIVDNTIATPYLIKPVRARRRHRRPLGDEVPRRPRHGHRRRHRRRRHVRVVEERRQVPRPHRARPVVPRRELHGRGRRRPRLHHQGARAAAARPRRRDRAAERVAAHPGHRDAVAAHRAPRAERAGDRRVAREPRRRRHRSTTRACRRRPWYAAANKYAPKGVGAVLSFELKGGVEAGREFVNSLDAVQPPRQHRRRALARHPPGVDDALAAHARAAAHDRRHAGPRAPLGRASRTSTTSRPTSSRRSPPRAPPAEAARV